jgi:hypothetical protein
VKCRIDIVVNDDFRTFEGFTAYQDTVRTALCETRWRETE